MKNKKMRLGVTVIVVGLAAASGWWIQRGRTVASTDGAATNITAINDLGDTPSWGDQTNAQPKPMVLTPTASPPADNEVETFTPTLLTGDQLLARGQNEAQDNHGVLDEPNPLRGARTSNIGSPPLADDHAAHEPRMVPTDAATGAQPLSPIAAAPVTPAAHGDQYNDHNAGGPTPMPPTFPLAAPPADGHDQPAVAPISPTRREDYSNPGSSVGTLPNVATIVSPMQPLPAGLHRPLADVQHRPLTAVSQRPLAVQHQPEVYNQGGDGVGRPGEQSLEGAQSPSLVIEKIAPEEIQVGKQCTFEIVVRNVGSAAAHQVRVFDEVPQGTQIVGTSPQANQATGGQITWDIGTLGPNEEQKVEVQLMPTDEGDIGSVATVSFAAKASIRTRCTRPLLELRTTSGRQVMIGDKHVVNVEINNPGSGDATGVMLLENIPEGVSHPSGESLEFEIGTLRAGETRKLELVLTAKKPGIIHNRLVAQADANLKSESSVDFEVIAPDLRVSINGPRRRYLERQATYTVMVDNPGTASTKDIELTTQLPKGMEFVKANNLGEYNATTHSVRWSLAELPPNEQGKVEIVMLAIESGEQQLHVETTAAMGLADQADQQVLVEGLAAIMFEVVDVDDPIEVGGKTSYEIRVVNQGSKTATNLRVTAVLSPGMTATNAAGPTQHQIGQGQVVFAPLARLAPKADTTFRVDVQGLQPGDQRFRVQVTTDEVQQPITKEESTRVYADQ